MNARAIRRKNCAEGKAGIPFYIPVFLIIKKNAISIFWKIGSNRKSILMSSRIWTKKLDEFKIFIFFTSTNGSAEVPFNSTFSSF